jgi:N-methylhydantoinase B
MKHVIPPNGCAGGMTGRPGDIWINPDSKDPQNPPKRLPTRYADYPLNKGDIFRLDTPGGGGHGDPVTREPERVLTDIREGFVTPDVAERDYGVVLKHERDALAVDLAATHERRKTMRRQ